MFFNQGVVYKVYSSRKAAESWVARNLPTATNIEIKEISNSFYVVGN